MLFVLGAISVFLIGGLTGPILAKVPTDMHLHDSYWVVGHFHATMFGGFIFPFLLRCITGSLRPDECTMSDWGQTTFLANGSGVLGDESGPNAHWSDGYASSHRQLRPGAGC